MFQKSLITIKNRRFSKKIFEKNKKNKFFFEKKPICEKMPSLSQKMAIFYKMSISGV